MEMDANDLALSHLSPRKVKEIYEQKLLLKLKQAKESDLIYRNECSTSQDRKNRKGFLRRSCLDSLFDEAHKQQQATLTQGEMLRRRANIAGSNSVVTETLLSRARNDKAPSADAQEEFSVEMRKSDEDENEADFRDQLWSGGHISIKIEKQEESTLE
jgi:hypothetical protein